MPNARILLNLPFVSFSCNLHFTWTKKDAICPKLAHKVMPFSPLTNFPYDLLSPYNQQLFHPSHQGKFTMTNEPNNPRGLFRIWTETRAREGNRCHHREHVQIQHQALGLNPGICHCETAAVICCTVLPKFKTQFFCNIIIQYKIILRILANTYSSDNT